MQSDDLAIIARAALRWQTEGVHQDPSVCDLLNTVLGHTKPAKTARRGKYNNQPTETDAGMADSKAEAKRWGELRLLEREGEIRDLVFHPRFLLPGNVIYEADSAYTRMHDQKRVVEDVKGGKKGTVTPVFRMKWKQMAERYPELELRIEER
jgi:hypothetical protein